MKPGKERMSNAKEAVKLHERLMKSGFFDVYASFNEFCMTNHSTVASWTDGNLVLMRKAAEAHFRAQHFIRGAKDEAEFMFFYENLPENLPGSHKGLIVYAKLHGEEEATRYYVK